ncbi:MAG: trimethylamine methyltransferase family protein, partial [Anaerolineales bacterium]
MSEPLPPLEPLRPAYRIQYFSEDELDRLQGATLDIMESVGVKFPSEKALAVLDGHGARVDKATQIVQFPRELVLKALKTVPRYFKLGARVP